MENYAQVGQVFAEFAIAHPIAKIAPYGSGHINDTYLVHTQGDDAPDYILQKINDQIFLNVPALMDNIVRVTSHVRQKLQAIPGSRPDVETLTVIPARTGDPFFMSPDLGYWRAYIFIPDSYSYDIVDSPEKAYQGGLAFGRFQNFLDDLPGGPLHETIPHFHNVERRLVSLFDVVESDPMDRVKEVSEDLRFIIDQIEHMSLVLKLGRVGEIPQRVTHNDTKFNNVLLDKNDQALCVIDLDTVMPGYVHYDFSDSIRTVTNTAAEDEADLSKVSMDIALFEAYSEGFLSAVLPKLNPVERMSLPETVDLLPFIIGVRFLTDYLEGDHYFKIHFPQHNLQRARAQLQLVRSMQAQKADIKRVFARLCKVG